MIASVNRSFLDGLGVAAAVTPTPSAPAPPTPSLTDDPALWTEPEQGGFADGFIALVDELHDTEKRIDQGNTLIADHKAASKPVPGGWLVRLQNLSTKRIALRKQLTDQYPSAVKATVGLVAQMVKQETWLSACPDDPRFAEQEDIWLATLGAYDRLSESIDRAFVTVAEETQEDPVSVSWTRAWDELEALGFGRDKAQVEAAIGGWSNDPREVVQRAKAARLTHQPNPTASPEPPLLDIAQVKGLMNRIAEEARMPEQFDDSGKRIPRSWT